MPKPRITLGLPVYNGERYLRQAIDSILRQSYTDYVLLIADNCSIDGTEAICRQYAASDQRIVYHRHERNIGVGANFDFLFATSDSDFFKWCPHDDVVAPDYLQRCIAELDANADAVLCHTDTLMIDENGDVIADSPALPVGLTSHSPVRRFAGFLLRPRICHESLAVMRSAAMRRTRGHQEYLGSDRALLADLMLQGRFLAIAEPLFMNRRHSAAASELAAHGAEVIAELYYPQQKPKRLAVVSRLYADLWRVVWRSRLGRGQKLSCSGVLLVWPFLPGQAMRFVREGLQYLPAPLGKSLRRAKRWVLGR